MMKRLTALLLSLIIVFSLAVPAFAHNKEGTDGHDQIMSWILFGSKSYKSTLSKASDEFKALEALENAVALSIDQYNGNYEDELLELQAMHICGLPDSISEINYCGNKNHRRYTHKGWNYNYQDDDKAHWDTRKGILLQTVNKVFNFSWLASNFAFVSKYFDFTEQCKAFSELLYYIHILADIPDSNYGEGYEDMCKLAVANPSANNPDIYFELLNILPIIFESQKSTRAYKGLISDIKAQASQARKFIKDTPDIKNNYSEYQKFADDLLDKLASKLPSLLQQEPFFRDVFYSNKVVNKAA